MQKLEDLCILDPADQLTYEGLIQEVEIVRRAAGLPSKDQRAPGWVSDNHIRDLITQIREELTNMTSRLYAEQCATWHNEKEAAEAMLEAAEDKIDRIVDSYVSEIVASGTPRALLDYMDEVKVLLTPSPTGPKASESPMVHWGVLPEPYLAFAHACVVVDPSSGDRIEYAYDDRLFDTVSMAPWTVERYSLEGRYIYIANNGIDLEHCVVWLLDRNRVVEFAKETQNAFDDLEAKAALETVENKYGYTADELAASLIMQANDRLIAAARGDLQAIEQEWITTRQTKTEPS